MTGAASGVEIFEAHGGSVVRIEFFHPKGNVLTIELVAALRSALGAIAGRRHLKLVGIAGRGADFSFGASVEEHAPGLVAPALEAMRGLLMDVLEVPAVTAALVRGRCLGGGFELALACDLLFAEEAAAFGLPEIRLGVFPPFACVLLPARVGLARAVPAILTGETLPATAWQACGLVERVAPPEALEATIDAWYRQHLEPLSAAALRHAVRAARAELKAVAARGFPALERLYLGDLMRTRDAREGIAAFLEKRPPQWQDE
jgi:cyclohexa-1,5-dienecarbonyl-CoA hydratase